MVLICFPTLEASVSLLAITRIMPQSSTLVAPHITYIRLRATTNISLLPFVLAIRLPTLMTFPLLIIHSLVVINLSIPCLIEHPTLVNQSVKITDLMKAGILINLRLQPTSHTWEEELVGEIKIFVTSRHYIGPS